MGNRYKAHHPEFYPIGWVSAAKASAEALGDGEKQSKWVSADWARGEAGAVARMKRMRAFRDGLAANRYNYQRIAELMDGGFELTFRKVQAQGVWDVQLCWKKAIDAEEILAITREAIGEDIAEKY